MTDWQPIDTAPKDGRAVLLCEIGKHGYEQYPEAFYWKAGNWYSKIDGCAITARHTHWMPQPKPPA